MGWKRQNPGSAFLSVPRSVRSSPTEEALWRPGTAGVLHAHLADHMLLICATGNDTGPIGSTAHTELSDGRTRQPIQSHGLYPNECAETLGALSQAAVATSKGFGRGAEVRSRSPLRTRLLVRRAVRYDTAIARAPWTKRRVIVFNSQHRHRNGCDRVCDLTRSLLQLPQK